MLQSVLVLSLPLVCVSASVCIFRFFSTIISSPCKVQRLFPNAEVTASDAFDDFVSAVWPHRASLPVVTAEIGDTWCGRVRVPYSQAKTPGLVCT